MVQQRTPEKILESFATIDTGSVDIKNRTFSAWVSTPTIDRDSEFCPVSAFTELMPDYIERNPVLLLGHSHKTGLDTLPIGKCINLEPKDEGLFGKFYITKRPVGDEILILLAEGILKGLSAGFVPIDVIRNPQDSQLPFALQGKGLKSYYKKVELVEISLLSIPSNRESLVIRAQGGNRVADLVLKSFDGIDVTPIIKQWLLEEKSNKLEDLEEEAENNLDPVVWKDFTAKVFGLWEEDKHPRDNDGQFTSSISSSPGIRPLMWGNHNNDTAHPELNRKLDIVIANQTRQQRQIEEINDKDSWENWAKKWVVRAAVVGGLYYGAKHVLKKPEVREKIRKWLANQASQTMKGIEEVDAIDKLLSILNLTSLAIKKAKKIGATQTPEYQKLNSFYSKMVSSLVEGVKSADSAKIETKEFTEEEHPRAVDGKFRSKSEGAGVRKAKAKHVDGNIRHDKGQISVTHVNKLKGQELADVLDISAYSWDYYTDGESRPDVPSGRKNITPAHTWNREDLKKEFGTGTQFTMLKENGKVVGYAGLMTQEGYGTRIVALATDPDRRREGIAKQLMQEIIKRQDGKIIIDVNNENLGAIHLYEELGFKPAVKTRDFMVMELGTRREGKQQEVKGFENIVVKSLGDFFIKIKEADFDESEHPRAPAGSDHGGEFISKAEIAHGGVRKNAGRMPRDPIAAKAKLEARFKAETPEISSDELHQKIIDFAHANQNADLVHYMNDPADYQKQREIQIMEAMASGRNNTKVAGEKIPKLETMEDVADVRDQVKTSASAWNRIVKQTKDVEEARKIFKQEDAGETDKANAKLIIAAATIATLVGATAMIITHRGPKAAGFNISEGAETLGRSMGISGKANVLDVDPTLTRFLHVAASKEELANMSDPVWKAAHPDWVYKRELNVFENLAYKIRQKQGKEGVTGLGPGALGYLDRYKDILAGEYKLVRVDPKKYIPSVGDYTAIGRRPLFPHGGKIPDPLAIAINNGRLPETVRGVKTMPSGLKKGAGMGPGGAITEEWEYKTHLDLTSNQIKKYQEAAKKLGIKVDKKAEDITGEDLFRLTLQKKTKVGEETLLPLFEKDGTVKASSYGEKIVQINTEKRLGTEAAQQYSKYSTLFNQHLISPLTGKILAMLTATLGATAAAGETAFYFQKDIEKAFHKNAVSEEEVAEHQARIARMSASADSARLREIEEAGKTHRAELGAQTAADKARAAELTAEAANKPPEEPPGPPPPPPPAGSVGVKPPEQKPTDEDEEKKEDKKPTGAGDTKAQDKRTPEQDAQVKADAEKFLKDKTDAEKEKAKKTTKSKTKVEPKKEPKKEIRKEVDKKVKERREKPPPLDKKQVLEDRTKAFLAGELAWKKEFGKRPPIPEGHYVGPSGWLRKNEKKINQGGRKGLSFLIAKAFGVDEEPVEQNNSAIPDEPNLDAMAIEIASMFADISQACKAAVESGMPGNSGYAELNNILNEIYVYMKHGKKNKPSEISQKGIDNAMSSQVDSSGGLFVGGKQCQKCGKAVTKELLAKCKENNCPNSGQEWQKEIEEKKE